MSDVPRQSTPDSGLKDVAVVRVPQQYPIPLNDAQQTAIKQWAADDRLWTTQDTVEINLRTFARVILQHAEVAGVRAPQSEKPQCPHGENCACAISTRHEWFIAFCDERDKVAGVRAPQQQQEWLDRIIAEYKDQNTREACDKCDGCGSVVMCHFHSLLSLLTQETFLDGAHYRLTVASSRPPSSEKTR